MGLSTEAQKQVREAAITELKGANMQDMTERKLRTALEKQLGLELGGAEEKSFLRGIIEEFLDRDEPEEEPEEAIEAKRRKTEGGTSSGKAKAPEAKGAKEGATEKGAQPEKWRYIGEGNLLVCELSGNKKVTVQKWKNQKLISIREYYEKNGEQLPGKKGISLTLDQWKVLRNNTSLVDEAVEHIS